MQGRNIRIFRSLRILAAFALVGTGCAVFPGVHLRMKCVANHAIKCIGIGAFEHHAEVVAVGPILFRSELLTHALVEPSVRKRVREGNTDVVGTRLANESDRLLNIVPILA